MQEDTFWEYIDLIKHVDTEGLNLVEKESYQVHLIKRKLIELDFKEVLVFHQIFNQKLYELFSPTLAEVFMVSWNSYEKLKNGNVYISNDGFRDFRSWIIGLGREEFEKFKTYEKEEDFLKYDLNSDIPYREDLEHIVVELYENLKKEQQSQIKEIYEKYSGLYCDGDYQLDLEDKIDWININKKYPVTLK